MKVGAYIMILTGLVLCVIGALTIDSNLPLTSSYNIGMLIGMIGGGAICIIVALLILRGGKRAAQKMQLIYNTGLDAEGIVTFFDRNLQIRINNRYIYAIVEYRFQDQSGMEHLVRKTTVDHEACVRNRIEMGSKVQIKYLPANPSKDSIILLQQVAPGQVMQEPAQSQPQTPAPEPSPVQAAAAAPTPNPAPAPTAPPAQAPESAPPQATEAPPVQAPSQESAPAQDTSSAEPQAPAQPQNPNQPPSA